MKKTKDLTIIALIYILAYVVGAIAMVPFKDIMIKLLVFDIVATIVTFVFSVIYKNSSVYDAYWSLTPMVMSIWLFVVTKAFSPMHILFLIVFNIWSARLTVNWICVFTDFSYEDWRYRKFRDESHPLLWPFVNFFGIHMMPTLVVFAAMLPLFRIVYADLDAKALLGMIIILMGVAFEFFADRQMHYHLKTSKDKSVCRVGLWKYSRHPNYLGEITVWIGVYVTMLPYALDYWFYGVGALAILLLFNVVSIPLMEKRQKERRPDYVVYCKETGRLLFRNKKV